MLKFSEMASRGMFEIIRDALMKSGCYAAVRIRRECDPEQVLSMYQRLGYAPTDPQALAKWKLESVKTWTVLDEIYPWNATVGFESGKAVSGWVLSLSVQPSSMRTPFVWNAPPRPR